MRPSFGSDVAAERLVRVETDNDHCEADRKEHGMKIENLEKLMNQMTGALRVMMVMWALLTGAVGIAAAAGFLGPRAQPAAHP